MTPEQKQLLLKVLCEQLPYGVILDNGIKLRSIDVLTKIVSGNGTDRNIEYVKPYLRPISSMTEEEKKWLYNNFDYVESFGVRCYDKVPEYYDWFNEHHFDYRGLIEKGLALEAPEGMYES